LPDTQWDDSSQLVDKKRSFLGESILRATRCVKTAEPHGFLLCGLLRAAVIVFRFVSEVYDPIMKTRITMTN